MSFLPGAVLLVAAVAALADGGLRVAHAAGARGGEAVLAAATLAASVVVAGTLALSLAGAAGSPVALALAALLPWAAVRARLPASPQWRWPAGPWALAAGAAAGGGAAWTAWVARHPGLGVDALTYHLTEAVVWVQRGNPGAVLHVLDDFPVGAYPVTNEVLVAWGMGVARSFAPALAWTPLAAALLVCAGWTGLRRLGATRPAAALGTAAVVLVPVCALQLIGPNTDLPALAWLAAAAALVAAGRPALLPFAVLAVCLAVGTKTTAAPLAVLVLAFGLLRDRRHLPVKALAAAAAAGVAVGGTWYLRNWVVHGSPLWPFVATPWGDPVPSLLELIDISFLDRPADTLRGRTHAYFAASGGAVLLLAGGVPAAALGRRRPVVALGAATGLAFLVWANAPFTGRALDPLVDFSISTVRYLFPAFAAGAAALAATRHPLAAWLLGVSAAVSLVKALDLPFPAAPGAGTLLAGGLAGMAACLVGRRVPPVVAVAGAAAAATGFLAIAAGDLPARHARASAMNSGGVIGFLAAREDRAPVASSFQALSVLAGDDLRRDLGYISRHEPCSSIRARLDRGWVVLATPGFAGAAPVRRPLRCLAGIRPAYSDREWRAYRPR